MKIATVNQLCRRFNRTEYLPFILDYSSSSDNDGVTRHPRVAPSSDIFWEFVRVVDRLKEFFGRDNVWRDIKFTVLRCSPIMIMLLQRRLACDLAKTVINIGKQVTQNSI